MKITLTALLTLAAPPVAAGELVWTGGAEEHNAALVYSEPGNIPLQFWCEKGVGVVNVAYEFTPAGAREGMAVDFVLPASNCRCRRSPMKS